MNSERSDSEKNKELTADTKPSLSNVDNTKTSQNPPLSSEDSIQSFVDKNLNLTASSSISVDLPDTTADKNSLSRSLGSAVSNTASNNFNECRNEIEFAKRKVEIANEINTPVEKSLNDNSSGESQPELSSSSSTSPIQAKNLTNKLRAKYEDRLDDSEIRSDVEYYVLEKDYADSYDMDDYEVEDGEDEIDVKDQANKSKNLDQTLNESQTLNLTSTVSKVLLPRDNLGLEGFNLSLNHETVSEENKTEQIKADLVENLTTVVSETINSDINDEQKASFIENLTNVVGAVLKIEQLETKNEETSEECLRTVVEPKKVVDTDENTKLDEFGTSTKSIKAELVGSLNEKLNSDGEQNLRVDQETSCTANVSTDSSFATEPKEQADLKAEFIENLAAIVSETINEHQENHETLLDNLSPIIGAVLKMEKIEQTETKKEEAKPDVISNLSSIVNETLKKEDLPVDEKANLIENLANFADKKSFNQDNGRELLNNSSNFDVDVRPVHKNDSEASPNELVLNESVDFLKSSYSDLNALRVFLETKLTEGSFENANSKLESSTKAVKAELVKIVSEISDASDEPGQVLVDNLVPIVASVPKIEENKAEDNYFVISEAKKENFSPDASFLNESVDSLKNDVTNTLIALNQTSENSLVGSAQGDSHRFNSIKKTDLIENLASIVSETLKRGENEQVILKSNQPESEKIVSNGQNFDTKDIKAELIENLTAILTEQLKNDSSEQANNNQHLASQNEDENNADPVQKIQNIAAILPETATSVIESTVLSSENEASHENVENLRSFISTAQSIDKTKENENKAQKSKDLSSVSGSQENSFIQIDNENSIENGSQESHVVIQTIVLEQLPSSEIIQSKTVLSAPNEKSKNENELIENLPAILRERLGHNEAKENVLVENFATTAGEVPQIEDTADNANNNPNPNPSPQACIQLTETREIVLPTLGPEAMLVERALEVQPTSDVKNLDDNLVIIAVPQIENLKAQEEVNSELVVNNKLIENLTAIVNEQLSRDINKIGNKVDLDENQQSSKETYDKILVDNLSTVLGAILRIDEKSNQAPNEEISKNVASSGTSDFNEPVGLLRSVFPGLSSVSEDLPAFDEDTKITGLIENLTAVAYEGCNVNVEDKYITFGNLETIVGAVIKIDQLEAQKEHDAACSPSIGIENQSIIISQAEQKSTQDVTNVVPTPELRDKNEQKIFVKELVESSASIPSDPLFTQNLNRGVTETQPNLLSKQIVDALDDKLDELNEALSTKIEAIFNSNQESNKNVSDVAVSRIS